MSREQAETLPEDLRDWVDQKAEALDTDRETILTRALAAYRLVEEDDDRIAGVSGERTDGASTLAERVDAVEAEFDEKIEDVRRRVVQVKRETDAKAPADHDHADLRDRLDEQEARVGDLGGALADLDERVESGFENYEDVLEYLTETTDELESRTATLARTVLDARDRLRELEAESAERAVAADIKSEANRHGAVAARCGECTGAVEIGLLTAPRCPHCGTTFGSFEPARGFLGSATLVPGNRPAIEGEADSVESPADLFEADRDE